MIEEKLIQNEIIQVQTLKGLVDAYEEIASIRMKKTRFSTLANRSFLNEISDIFEQVRKSYASEAAKFAKKRKGKEQVITFLPHNGKTVAVFLSANTGLYGDIVNKTYDQFNEEVNLGTAEVTIVGKHGLSIFLTEHAEKPYTFFDYLDHGGSLKELSDIVRHIVQYEEIHVYYGKFKNVISQDATMLNISSELTNLKNSGDKRLTPYIFEPSLEAILMFFETEIFASLFEQAVRESELAKFASRFLAMDKANLKIQERLKKLHFEKLKVLHNIINRKQINSFSNLYLNNNYQ